jgi:hypothetical protein
MNRKNLVRLLIFCFILIISNGTVQAITTGCVDEYGNTIPDPSTVYLTGDFSYVSTGAGGLGKIQGGTKPSSLLPMAPSSYNSVYSSSNFKLTEEDITNYNQIGNKVGTHWLQAYLMKHYSNINIPVTIPVYQQQCVTVAGEKHCSYVSVMKTTYQNYPIIQYATMNQGLRPTITTINTHDPIQKKDITTDIGNLTSRPDLQVILNVHNTGDAYTNSNCLASAYILLGNGNTNPWNKLIIMADGFDPLNTRGIQELIENTYFNCNVLTSTSSGSILNKGYNVMFVDFGKGGDDINSNAKVLLKIIEYACSKATTPVIVGGFSMGGLIARTALLLGEKNIPNSIANVKKFVSVDSPQKGAQINTDMQVVLNGVIDNYMSGLISVVDITEYERLIPNYYSLNSIAAQQMLFYHNKNNAHDAFYTYVSSIGYFPSSKIKKYSVADACWKWPYPGFDNNGQPKQQAGIFNSSFLYVQNEDVFPGTFIDLWGDASTGLFIWFGAGLVLFPPGSPNLSNDSYFKPTFIPTYSVFGITKTDFKNITPPNNQNDLDAIAKQYSPFDKLYIVDNLRNQHITFNNNLTQTVSMTLKNNNISAILSLLLND